MIPLTISPDQQRAPFILLLVLLHIVAIGAWLTRAVRFHSEDFWTKLAVLGGIGYFGLGIEMFVLGHVGALNRAAMLVSTAIVLAALWPLRSRAAPFIRAFAANLRELARESPILMISMGILLLVTIASGMRPSIMDDDYHYGAPLDWVAHGHWVHSHFRMMDSAAIMEMLYTIGAIFDSPTTGHWIHSLLILFMAAGLAGIGKKIGGGRMAYIAAVMVVPSFGTQLSCMGTDDAVVAFCIITFAALFNGARDEAAPQEIAPATARAIGLLLAGALSTKTMGVIPPTVVILAYVLGLRLHGARITALRSRLSLRCAMLIVTPIILTAVIWMIHCYALSGHLTDSRGITFVTDPNDWRWKTGSSVGRIPRPIDIALIPVVPFYVSIFGQKEPYGGRTGLLLVVFVWVGIAALGRLSLDQRRHALWMLGAGLFYYLSIAAFIVKTRYLAFSWTAMNAMVGIAYVSLNRAPRTLWARLGNVLFILLVWAGMLDVIRKMLMGLILKIPAEHS